jgi:hypothetical protein
MKDRYSLIHILEHFPALLSDEDLAKIFTDIALMYAHTIQNSGTYTTTEGIIEMLPKFNVGDMNFMFTWLIHKAVVDRGLRYVNLNNLVSVYNKAKEHFEKLWKDDNFDVDGAFLNSMAEFIRRIVVPYENLKIRENGCVSQLEKDLHPEDPYYGE